MPRGVRGSSKDLRTIDEKIIDIDKEIESHKQAITDLSKDRKALLNAKAEEDKEEVRKIAAESGLTAAELRELIDKHKKAK